MIAQASPAAGPLRTDSSKRVNYTLGLVLGVDEFQQDQLYHAAGRRGHNRLLHGYGTVWGLHVGDLTTGAEPEIQVQPGVAVDPCGREICVPDRMCVRVNRWLDRHRDALEPLLEGAEVRTLPVAVVLCYRECPTDTVPVPGEPCRSQDDAMQPSRIRESFELKLMLRDDAPWGSVPPGGVEVFRLFQPEEQAVRAFGLLLARVQTSDPALAAGGEEALLAAVRALARAADEDVLASPPEEDHTPILLPEGEAPRILRRAFRAWVTEVRPAIRRAESPRGCGDADGECCVLLAEFDLPVTAHWAVDQADAIRADEERRPYLLHTRLLQEWLIAGGGDEERPDVDSWATLQVLGPSRVRVWLHHEAWLNLPAEAIALVLNDKELDPGEIVEVPWGGVRNVWDVVIAREMADGDVLEIRFDTARIPMVSPPPEEFFARVRLEDRVRFADLSKRELRSVTRELRELGETARWSPETAAPVEPPRTVADDMRGPTGEFLDRFGLSLSAFTVYDRIQGGDLEGEYQLPIVAKIQQFPVDRATPGVDEYLVSDGAKWLPRPLPDGRVDLAERYPDSRVVGLQGRPLSDQEPQPDHFLGWDGTRWAPEPLPDGTRDLSGRYPDNLVRGLQGTPVSSAAPTPEQYLRFDGVSRQWLPSDLPDARGTDLAGRYPELTVTGLRGRALAPGVPTHGQVLTWREPSPGTGQWTAVTPTAAGTAGGDLAGNYPSPTVARLRGRNVAATTPAEGQVLVYRESSPPGNGAWTPAAPPAGATGAATGDLTGTYPGPQVAGLRGRPIAGTAPAEGQVLVYRESSPPGNGTWTPMAPPAGGGASGAASGDLAGNYPGPTVVRLRGRLISTAAPAEGQVLTFANGQWVPAAPPSGGTGGAASGDLSGTYPGPRVAALQGRRVLDVAPDAGQYLRWTGDGWAPAAAVAAPRGEYAIVGAGRFAYDGQTVTPLERPYNELGVEITDERDVLQLLIAKFNPEDQYIVKGTWEAGAVLLAPNLEDRGGQPRIRLFRLDVDSRVGELHLEVSRYPLRLSIP